MERRMKKYRNLKQKKTILNFGKFLQITFAVRKFLYSLLFTKSYVCSKRQKLPYCSIFAKVLTIAKKGFTLVELMLVVIIISVLVAMVVPRLSGRSEEARIAVAKADIDLNIATALKLYELDNGGFPTTEEGLDGLLSAPASAQNWKGPYLDKKPLDPWGRIYQYKCPGAHRQHDFDLYSLGKDGVESVDDVVNWIE